MAIVGIGAFLLFIAVVVPHLPYRRNVAVVAFILMLFGNALRMFGVSTGKENKK
jgi:hypothetical protein